MIERTETPSATPATSAAQRRVFRSKVDTIRPTYGFEDVSLAPGHRHDRAIRRRSRPDRSAASTSRSRSSPRRWTPSSMPGWPARWPGSAASRSSTSRASRRATTIPTRSSRGSPRRPTTRSRTCSREVYQQPIREELIARRHRGDPRRRVQGRGRRHAGRRPPVRPVLRRARRRPVPRPEPGLVAPATSRPSTTRCRSPTSPATCRSPSRSATRPTPRRRSR